MEFITLEKQTEETAAYLKRRESFSESGLKVVVSPYRISPLGAHIDHQGGPVLGMTVGARTVLAFIPAGDKRMRLYSMNYPGVSEFDIDGIKSPGRDDWGRYAMGAAKALGEHRSIRTGFTGILSGTLPSAGLGSSASSGLACLKALACANELVLGPEEYIELERRIENDYLRLSNGIADQSSIVYGRKDSLLYIDTVTGHTAAYPRPKNREDFKILIVYSGIPRALASSGFNTRVEECRKAAGLLGIMGGLRSAKTLSYIPETVFREKSSRLPEELRRRAEHFFTESGRVTMGVAAWQRGDINAFGRLMNESSESSFVNFGVGRPELESLHEIISSTSGVYGSGLNGRGYGGSVTAFVTREFTEDSAAGILERYKERHPETGMNAAAYFAESDDGIRLI